MPGGGGRRIGWLGRDGVGAGGRAAFGVGVGRTAGRGAVIGRTGSCGRGVGSIGTSTARSVSRLSRRGGTIVDGSRANGPAIVSTVAGFAVADAPAATGVGRVPCEGANVRG